MTILIIGHNKIRIEIVYCIHKLISLVKNKMGINYCLTLSMFHVEIISKIKSRIKV